MSMNNDEENKPQVIHPVTEEFNEDQRKLVKQLVEAMGVNELSARTDRLETTMEKVITRLDEVITANNNVISHLQNNSQPQTGPTIQQPTNGLEKLEAIGKIVQTLEPLFDKYMRPAPVPQTILDPEIINQHLRDSMLGNFEIGKALTDTLKNKVTQKALGQVVSDIIKHEPA